MRVDYPRDRYDGVRRFVPSFRQILALAMIGFVLLVGLVGFAYSATSIPAPKSLISAQTGSISRLSRRRRVTLAVLSAILTH